MLELLRYSENAPGATATDRKKALLFAAICRAPAVTRKQLAEELGIRPATVSDLVAELLDQRLVREGEAVSGNRKGRPEIALHPVPERLAVIVVHVVSSAIRGVLVDMAGRVRAEHKPRGEVAESTDTATLESRFLAIIEELQRMAPGDSEIIGVGLALPGIVDQPAGRWIFSSRWPRMADMTFEGIAARTGLPVRLMRNLTAELGGHLMTHPKARAGGTAFVHWGFGIGASYAYEGRLSQSGNAFGELGHWTGLTGSGRPCRCGRRGCLETEAALWGLLAELRQEHPDTPGDEWEFEDFLRHRGLGNHPAVVRATGLFAAALHNLQMVLFPRLIILTGPFVQDPEVFASLKRQFLGRLPDYASQGLEITTARRFAEDEIVGVAAYLFDQVLRRRLVSGGKP